MAASCAWLGSARLIIHLLLTSTLPVGSKFIAPVEVMVIFVPTMALELMLAPVILPLALTTDPNRLAPVTVPVELISPPVNKLPPVILAALVIVPVADISPPVNKLPPVILPVLLNEVSTPTEVILACELAVTYCTVPADVAYVALATVPVTLAPVMLVNKLPSPMM